MLHVTVFQKTFHDFVAEKQSQFPKHAHVLAPARVLGCTLFKKESVSDSRVSAGLFCTYTCTVL